MSIFEQLNNDNIVTEEFLLQLGFRKVTEFTNSLIQWYSIRDKSGTFGITVNIEQQRILYRVNQDQKWSTIGLGDTSQIDILLIQFKQNCINGFIND